MNSLRFSSAFASAVILTGAMALTACSGDDDTGDAGVKDTGTSTGTDSGTPIEADSGTPTGTDAGRDAGPRPDTGPRPDAADTCINGTEGCECTSSLTPQTDPPVFMQDDCGAGLVCVPFDLGRTDLTGPLQACLKTCLVDGDCGSGRVCRASGFNDTTGAPRVCFDEQANDDEFCHLSRLTASRLSVGNPPTPVTVQSGPTLRGCRDGVSCLFGVFTDVHPDEGICLNFCDAPADCSAPTGYCNPRVFTGTSSTGQMVDIGVCSTARLGMGSVCGSADPEKSGVASRCDTSGPDTSQVACIPVSGLFPGTSGFCAQICGSANACEGNDPGLPQHTCRILDPMDAMQGGICETACTSFPDDCQGNGIGLGRVCVDNQLAIDNTPYTFCMDRQGPALAAATLDATGMLTTPGDDCAMADLGFGRCPEPGYCQAIDPQLGTGACLVGCSRTATISGCQLVTATATCADVFNGQPFGACGVP